MKNENSEKIRTMYHLNKEVVAKFKKLAKENGLNMSGKVELMIIRFMEEYKE